MALKLWCPCSSGLIGLKMQIGEKLFSTKSTYIKIGKLFGTEPTYRIKIKMQKEKLLQSEQFVLPYKSYSLVQTILCQILHIGTYCLMGTQSKIRISKP